MMRKSKLTKKKGRLQKKRMHKQATQTRPELTIRDYEDRQAWIQRRDKKK